MSLPTTSMTFEASTTTYRFAMQIVMAARPGEVVAVAGRVFQTLLRLCCY